LEEGGFNHTGADADKDAHGLLTVIPNGDSANYTFGVPGLFVDADFTDDVTSDCGTSNHSAGVVLLGATGTGATGTIQRDATTISGGTNYQSRDGLFGKTMNYTATWNLQKM
jgi:hypothetical protein